jgi:hypothetical protein
MSSEKKKWSCSHCNSEMKPFQMPEEGGWNGVIHYACFNDDCSYFVEGWEWIMEKYEVKSSYRYRIDPQSGVSSPLPVWSKTALLDRIIKS